MLAIHPPILVFPAVVRPFADPLAPTEFAHLLSGFYQFQNVEDLLLRKPCLFHTRLLVRILPGDSLFVWLTFLGAGHTARFS